MTKQYRKKQNQKGGASSLVQKIVGAAAATARRPVLREVTKGIGANNAGAVIRGKRPPTASALAGLVRAPRPPRVATFHRPSIGIGSSKAGRHPHYGGLRKITKKKISKKHLSKKHLSKKHLSKKHLSKKKFRNKKY